MTSEGFAQPWADFEDELGERMLLDGPLSSCLDGFARYGGLIASRYAIPPPDPSIRSDDSRTDDGTGIKVRTYMPKGYAGNTPIGVFFHGGGWCMGSVDGDDAFARSIAKAGNCVVVSVDYRLAPHNKHPGLINDCFDGLSWALANAAKFGADPGRFFTCGVSAGAGLAIGTALKALDKGLGDALLGVVALVPATVHPKAVPEDMRARYTSYQEHDRHTINTASAMEAFWDALGAPPSDPYTSPLLHPRISCLKKVYLAVAGHDTLRDDGLLLKQKLDDHKVPNMLDFYEGYPHYHWVWPSSKLHAPRTEFNANLAKGVQYVTRGSEPGDVDGGDEGST